MGSLKWLIRGSVILERERQRGKRETVSEKLGYKTSEEFMVNFFFFT